MCWCDYPIYDNLRNSSETDSVDCEITLRICISIVTRCTVSEERTTNIDINFMIDLTTIDSIFGLTEKWLNPIISFYFISELTGL